jgi:hypothetical protein
MRVFLLGGLLWVGLSGCQMGPSEERLDCLRGCGRAKDDCMLGASTAEHVQHCDARSQGCNEACP